MKKLILNNRFLMFAGSVILCAGILVFVATCKDENENNCKACTNAKNVTQWYCDYELEKVQNNPDVTCK